MQQRGHRKTREGIVVSSKMDKTAVIEGEIKFIHKKYKKTVTRHMRFVAHDPENKCKEGDMVVISEIRPMSKTKRWRIEQIIGSKGIYKGNDTSSDQA